MCSWRDPSEGSDIYMQILVSAQIALCCVLMHSQRDPCEGSDIMFY